MVKGLQANLIQGPEESILTVSSCFYKNFFDIEDVPQLTAACCCSQDRVWLEGAPRKGVNAGLESCMAQGDASCKFFVSQEQK